MVEVSLLPIPEGNRGGQEKKHDEKGEKENPLTLL
jgi:hypothetical protein